MLNVLRSWLALVPWQRHELLSEEPFDLRPVRLADGAEKYFVIVRARILVDYYVSNFKGEHVERLAVQLTVLRLTSPEN
jgi:hypothetical protein